MVHRHGTDTLVRAILAQGKGTDMAKLNDISIDYYLSQQTWNYIRITTTENRVWKIRVWIKRNAYDFQSSMVGSVWSRESMQWNTVIRRPIKGANCQRVSYTDKNASAAYFRNDSDQIIEQVLKGIT